ncbi:MAG: alpha-D-ribose 1-methylphosphonate 5-triphosphate diphosphatase [Spirochaetales bacterium]|nr:alpha-D-ribose 1-methylphosphonate 5-triphosphate diphosphatase [Spirochaetales bacterium]
MNEKTIYNARIVTPCGIIENGTVLIYDGRIERIIEDNDNCLPLPGHIDACGKWLLPGFIDIHNDGLEKELQPRPHTDFPFALAFYAFCSRLINHGITTIFHSISFIEGRAGFKSQNNLKEMICSLLVLKRHDPLRHYFHARYDITEPEHCPLIISLMADGAVHLVSLMDHTPGQGQYRNSSYFFRYMKSEFKLKFEEIEKIIAEKKTRHSSDDIERHIRVLASASRYNKIPMASHDDDSVEKVQKMKSLGVRISEFPVDIETAYAAKLAGLYVTVGAPNIIMGKSTSGNLSAIEAVKEDAADIICSDYYAPGMLFSVFALYRIYGIPLPRAVNMVSLIPARAVGLAHDIGSIEEGKKADMMIVSEAEGVPFIEKVFIDGEPVLDKINAKTIDDPRVCVTENSRRKTLDVI